MSGKGKKRTAIKISEVYGDLIEGAPDSIVAMDMKGKITYCNKATEILTGYGKEKLIGKHFSRVGWIKNKEISHCLKLFKALLSNKKVAPFEREISHKDGKSYWVEVHVSKIKAKGKVTGFRANIRDITERRLVEESLKQKVLELNSFINNIPDMAWLKDDKSRFIALNKAFGEIVDMKPEILTGQTCEVCFGAKAGKKFREDDLKVMKGRRQVSIEEKILDSKGNELWLESIKSPIFGESGKVVGTVGIARNVTERKRIEKALIQKELIARERARLLTDLRRLDQIDDILTRVCEAVRDSGLFERAVMTLHDQVGQIVHLGQVGLPPDVVKRARQAPPIDQNLRSRVTSKKFRISDSFFIPAEAGVDFSRTGRYVPQKRKNSVGGTWQPGDELFVPLRDFSEKTMGYLSVDTPTDGFRPDVKTIQALEMLVEAAARVREVEAHDALKRERDFSQSILETANSMILCLDADAKITVFNQECERVTGYRREEVLGKRWPELFLPPNHHHFKLKSFANWVRAHPRDRYEGPIIAKSGEIRTILWSNTAILGSGKKDVIAIAIGHDITERKRAEEALRDSEEKFRTLAEQSPNMIFINKKGRVIYANQKCKEIMGYKRDEFYSPDFDFLALVAPEYRELVKARLARHIMGKEVDPYEYALITKEGKRIEAILSTKLISYRGEDAILGIITDITERKRAEEALRESEQRFRSLVETTSDWVWEVDQNGIYTYASPKVKDLLGYEPEEIIGKTPFDLMPPDEGERVAGLFKNMVESRKPFAGLENTNLHKDGRHVVLETSGVPILDASGNLLGYRGIDRDITERKRAEEALRESEKKYRTLVETAQEGIGITDPEENFTFINQAFADMLGYKKEELLGKNLRQISDEEEFAKFRKETQKRKQGKSSKYEAELLTKRGKPKYFYASAVPIRAQNGRFEGTLGVLTDITELKKAQEQNLLLETSKALSRTLKLDQVLKIATKKMAKALKADHCGVAFTDQNMHSLTIKHVYVTDDSSSPALLGHKIPISHFPEAQQSFRTKGYYQILNTRTDPIHESLRKYLLRTRVKSCLIIPTFIGKKLLGLFNVGSVKELRNFTKEEIRLAQTIANQVAVAVENSLLLEDIKGKHDQIVKQTKVLERQYQEQAILMKVSRELSRTLNLDRILQIATKEAAQALQVDRCAVALAFPEKGYAEIRSIYVKGKKSVTHLVGYKLYEHQFPQAKEMFEKRKLINIPNIYHLPDKSFAKEYFIKEGIKSAIFAPMVHGKKVVGFFVISAMKDFRTFTREETKLAQTIADQVAVAIENARLLELVRRSSDDLKTLSAQLINVQEDERKKLAQELHDEIGQTLFAMKMNLDVTMKNLPPDIEKLEDIKSRLSDTEDLLSQTIDQIRNLTTDLRPSMLDDFGLTPALRWYMDNFSKRTNIKVYLTTKNFKGRLSSEIETTLYRIIQEALTNVAKHAQATEVLILLSRKNSTVSLSLQDNGIGFDTKKITFPKDRFGLFSIKERIKLLNGEFKIGSKPNRGTKLSVKIFLAEKSTRRSV